MEIKQVDHCVRAIYNSKMMLR